MTGYRHMTGLPTRRSFLRLAACCLPSIAFAQSDAGFPRTIAHALGQTEIKAPPRRIVSVGYHEQDFLYALGIAPVGVHEWFGGHPYATWNWAEKARKKLNARPEVQNGFEIDTEWVYARKPDLIIASFFNLPPSTYHLLSRIAPVIAAPEGYPVWGAPWEAELRLIARATGTESRAEAVISDIGQQIRKLAAANPGFRNHTATIGYFAADHFVGYRSGSGSNRLLQSLGLQTPAIFDELVQSNGQFSVSPERIDLFEVDAVLWLVDAVKARHIRDMPIYRNTRLARERRSIWADPDLNGALSFMSPLSIRYALGQLAPLLQDALDGDPGTGTQP